MIDPKLKSYALQTVSNDTSRPMHAVPHKITLKWTNTNNFVTVVVIHFFKTYTQQKSKLLCICADGMTGYTVRACALGQLTLVNQLVVPSLFNVIFRIRPFILIGAQLIHFSPL